MPNNVKTNSDLLIEITKSLSSIHKKQDNILKNIENLEIRFNDFQNKMPERKSGWFNDYWEMKKN